MKYIFALLIAAFLVVAPLPANASRGGSNFMFYKVDGCTREPYGVLKNYHTAKADIDAVLHAMRAAGQSRLRIPISHLRGAVGGTNMDSSGGNLAPQYRENLANLLATIKADGFSEVIVGFFPQSNNNPWKWAGTDAQTWTAADESIFQENWNLIYNLVPIIKASGLHYSIDLGNELAPPKGGSYAWNHYAWKMWANYSYVFGRDNTVGFSLPAPDRTSNMRNIYGDAPPYKFDVHVYDNAYSTFLAYDNGLDAIGYKVQGVIVGETYYNDAQSAQEISLAAAASGRTVFFLTQWPLTRAHTCSDVDVVPKAFDKYELYGY